MNASTPRLHLYSSLLLLLAACASTHEGPSADSTRYAAVKAPAQDRDNGANGNRVIAPPPDLPMAFISAERGSEGGEESVVLHLQFMAGANSGTHDPLSMEHEGVNQGPPGRVVLEGGKYPTAIDIKIERTETEFVASIAKDTYKLTGHLGATNWKEGDPVTMKMSEVGTAGQVLLTLTRADSRVYIVLVNAELQLP